MKLSGSTGNSKVNIKTLKPSWLRKMKKKNFRAGAMAFYRVERSRSFKRKKKECPLGKKKKKKKKKQMAGN